MELNAVFLCDRRWTIQSFMRISPELKLVSGQRLTEITEEAAQLQSDFGPRCRVALTFPALGITIPALIHTFPKGYLVILMQGEGALEAAELCADALDWAKDRMEGLFRNEYYEIQQLNNQLIDSKRALARTNSRLHQALEAVEQSNRELEEAQRIAEDAMEAAQRASRSKTSFLASVSHDIRTPMNAILGFVSLMEQEGTLTEKQAGYLKKMRASGEHLVGLINDVLDITRIEASGMTLEQKPLRLSEQIAQVDAVIRPQAQAKGQHFAVDGARFSMDRLLGDGVRLRQVLINLLSNAVKYTPERGAIRLEIRQAQGSKAGFARMVFRVSDTGCGMTAEFAARVFDPFARDDRVVKNGIQGTGLGIAITKHIVDSMGGTIQLTTAVNQGSCFTVTLELPIDESKAEELAPAAPAFRFRGRRFLCAEDNAINAEILKELLALSGAECIVYPDGQKLLEAFASVRSGDYDAILMDVQMPHMDGLEATRRIRAGENPLGKTIPIIAMTANAFASDVQRCLDAGMNAHVAKPIDMTALEKALGQVL